jgi:hypothetical protein
MILRPQIMISFELTVDEVVTTDEPATVTSIRMPDTRNYIKINTHQKSNEANEFENYFNMIYIMNNHVTYNYLRFVLDKQIRY